MKQEAKIIKIGNSYGLRLPKAYLACHNLELWMHNPRDFKAIRRLKLKNPLGV